MITTNFIDSAKVMSKGQITIPKDIRDILGVKTGDRVTFVVDKGNIRVVNSAVYAMQAFQESMQDEAERAGLENDDDIAMFVTQMRAENNNENTD